MEDLEQKKRPQDEIPYELRMKNIIRGYRWLERQLEKIVPYTKKLEKENEVLHSELSLKGWKNLKINEKKVELRKENKLLKEENKELKKKIEELESMLAWKEKNISVSTDSDINIRLDDLNFDS